MKQITYKTPQQLAILTKKSKAGTLALITKLINRKPKKLDDMVHEYHYELFSGFDCLDCANCCKTIGPRLTEKDITQLAACLKMKSSAFVEKFILIDEDGDYVFREHPCPFLLSGNYCQVYDNRPKACREYPHTDRKRFIQILELSHKNCETCPVVYEIFELMKKNSPELLK